MIEEADPGRDLAALVVPQAGRLVATGNGYEPYRLVDAGRGGDCHGAGASVYSCMLGISQNIPVEAYVPMIMFAIVFGLSMDYEVFLLSRVKEAGDRTRNHHEVVATGLASTARVITCAALIMIAVFISSVTSPWTRRS
jgi:MMPL family